MASSEKQEKLSTESYKGVRDFYPEDMFVQDYIFNTWRKVVEGYGYQEYNASVLEPSDLYKAKSGEEIVNEQTYTFKDRGDRDVTLRPEMTPTVARMVAARKRELGFPLRWYSIPNLFRYEQPQRGRLREHWQLNVDVFGINTIEADVEGITIAHDIMLAFGAKKENFQIVVNSRRFFKLINTTLGFTEDEGIRIAKITDKMKKMETGEFTGLLTAAVGPEKALQYFNLLNQSEANLLATNTKLNNSSEFQEILILINKLKSKGIDVVFQASLMRGFDYYTGVVFEVFDTNPKNRRSLFGGGRYDDLLSLFGGDTVPAFGFGMGDVTMRDFLETHDLLPNYKSNTKLHVCVLNESLFDKADAFASTLRADGLTVSVDFTGRKVADQIKTASKQAIPFITVIGDDEIKSGIFKIKNLETGAETSLETNQISVFIASAIFASSPKPFIKK